VSGAIAWALLTGMITGGVWVAIVLLGRIRRISDQQPAQPEDMRQRLEELEQVERRLAELEERLEFTERLLIRQREAARLPPTRD
jgi:predicted nuclease with TOPRIM domain